MDKKIPINPKYANVKSKLDTGPNINKVSILSKHSSYNSYKTVFKAKRRII